MSLAVACSFDLEHYTSLGSLLTNAKEAISHSFPPTGASETLLLDEDASSRKPEEVA